jgi:hypothetical protein
MPRSFLRPDGPPIALIAKGWDVTELAGQLHNPGVWNRHKLRTQAYQTPHKSSSDIWVRFRPWDEVLADQAHCCDEHVSEWYPVVRDIPAVIPLIDQAVEIAEAETLGGVLITKVPPGGHIAPHVDRGWHPEHYRKIAIQIAGNNKQAFCFENGTELRPETGDVYEFRNQQIHWVTNDSREDRVTLIVCVR